MSSVGVVEDQKDEVSFGNRNDDDRSAVVKNGHQKDETIASATNSTTSSQIDLNDIPKHPLRFNWVLWYCKPERLTKWEDCMKEVITFNTVEDFWAMYNHIQPASGLPVGSDYYMFKQGIQPMWEDPHNCKGGRWLVTVERNRRDILDHYWLELLMAMIGEQFDDFGEFIAGAVVNIRQKGDKVSLWTSDSSKEDVNRRIGQILKQKLGVAESITYELHQDTKQKSSSTVKSHLRI